MVLVSLLRARSIARLTCSASTAQMATTTKSYGQACPTATPPKAAAAPPAHTEPGCANRGEASALHSLPGEENRCGTRLEVRMWLCGSD